MWVLFHVNMVSGASKFQWVEELRQTVQNLQSPASDSSVLVSGSSTGVRQVDLQDEDFDAKKTYKKKGNDLSSGILLLLLRLLLLITFSSSEIFLASRKMMEKI